MMCISFLPLLMLMGQQVEVSVRIQNVGSVQAHVNQIQDWLGVHQAVLLTETRADLMRQICEGYVEA